VDWMHLTQGRDGQVAGSCEHGNEILGSIKDGVFTEQVGDKFSRRTLLHGI
jgi:hypothetical protein